MKNNQQAYQGYNYWKAQAPYVEEMQKRDPNAFTNPTFAPTGSLLLSNDQLDTPIEPAKIKKYEILDEPQTTATPLSASVIANLPVIETPRESPFLPGIPTVSTNFEESLEDMSPLRLPETTWQTERDSDVESLNGSPWSSLLLGGTSSKESLSDERKVSPRGGYEREPGFDPRGNPGGIVRQGAGRGD